MEDATSAKMPTAATCGSRHDEQESQFLKGQHALSWTVM